MKAIATQMLSAAGIDTEVHNIEPIDEGRNNQGFVIHTDTEKYFAKRYFSHASDFRNRLQSEYTFLTYAWNKGIRSIPQPIASSPDKSIAIYGFVMGKKISAATLTFQHVMDAATFIEQINSEKRGATISMASDSAFSIADHFLLVDQRMELLKTFPEISSIDRQAKQLIAEMEIQWLQIKQKVSAKCACIHTDLNLHDRCISPSDFGFHNALLSDFGNIHFLDFEYAGWDDPAKMCCDFFCQPEVPIPLEYFDAFTDKVLGYSNDYMDLKKRTKILFPVFQLKWCCIMLNEFLPDAAMRRAFANLNVDVEQKKQLQLEKTQAALMVLRLQLQS